MPSIAFFELEPWEQEYLSQAFEQLNRKFVNGNTVTFFTDRLTAANVGKVADVEVLNVFIFSRIDEALLASMPALKHINTMSTGFDHIDLKACARRGITVSNVPSYGENTVAEHAFALLLTLSRKIIPAVEQTRRGNFGTGPALRGFDLKGKTLGVIGTGRIGRNAIRMGKGFDMNIIAFDAMPNEAFAKEIGFTYEKDLTALLAKSDVITVHAPDLPSTHHMINMSNIDKVKRGCIFINTARGGLIETEALLYGLESGIFAAAGLDVLEEEMAIKEEKQLLISEASGKLNMKTLLQQHALLNLENVIITPHNAFNSEEALRRILDTTMQNISSWMSRTPQNLIKA